MFRELLVIIFLWYIAATINEYQDEDMQKRLGDWIQFLRTYQGSTRTCLSFMLVYYYQQIYSRARGIFFAIPWPDNPFFMTACFIGTKENDGLARRKQVFRYLLATTFLVYHGISDKFKAAYPDPFDSLKKLGILNDFETEELERRFEEFPYLNELNFVPLAWCQKIITESFSLRTEQDWRADRSLLARVVESIRDFRQACANVLFEVYLPFPVFLSQLVTILTYMQILITLFAQQNSHEPDEPTFFFPIFTVVEALAFIGALRVGQIYTNPLGADDDDYEMVSFFNRNVRLASLYGCFGNDDSFDIASSVPPLADLSAIQDIIISRVPITIYDYEHHKSSLLSGGDDGNGNPTATNRPPSPAPINTPDLRKKIMKKRKIEKKTSFKEPLLNPCE
ncbi:hypothetical protein TL16_g10412 [Triparma laevis f. inornata]|nr:hypothetical protein TL16_g10412 [Triparma laevis f. inornata]